MRLVSNLRRCDYGVREISLDLIQDALNGERSEGGEDDQPRPDQRYHRRDQGQHQGQTRQSP